MLRHYIKIVAVVGIAAFLYVTLAAFLVGYSFGVAPGLQLMETTFGRVGGGRLWAHTVHALALVISAIPGAIILTFVLRPRAIVYAAVTGVIATIAVLADTLLRPDLLSILDPMDYLHLGIDSLKGIVILMLLTWLLTKLPSNNAMQRSSRVVTPLAGTGAREDGLGPASGAPTARRR